MFSGSSPSTSGTTFECYYRDTAQPVDIRASLGRCKELGKSTQVSGHAQIVSFVRILNFQTHLLTRKTTGMLLRGRVQG